MAGLVTTFPALALSQMLAGTGWAFSSGADVAWITDELDRPDAGVNFDPANMILYGMGDPVDALRRLAPRVRQVHVKDARAARMPGTWGEEVRVGTGEVDWPAFFGVLRAGAPHVDLMIEREAGEDRVGDILRARELVEGQLARDGARR